MNIEQIEIHVGRPGFVEYKRGVSMSSWNSLKATGLAVRKVSTDVQCPMCAETVKRAAKKCRFCGTDLTVATPVPVSAQHTSPGARQEPQKSARRAPKPHRYNPEPLKSTDNNRTMFIVFAVILGLIILAGMLSGG